MSNLKAGAAKVVITPPVGTILAGYSKRGSFSKGLGYDLKSMGVHDDLYARAIILETKKETFVLVVCELIGLDRIFVQEVRSSIKKKTGIKEENIMVAATHCHCGPILREGVHNDNFFYGPVDKNWKELLKQKIVSIVEEAKEKLEEAKIGVNTGSIYSIANNRRFKLDNGKVINSWEKIPEGRKIVDRGIFDPEVGVISIRNLSGELIAILANYTCHPCIYPGLLISSEFFGYAAKLVERIKNCIALFTNGACGDINSDLHVTKRPEGEEEEKKWFSRETERLGSILGFEVLKVIEETINFSSEIDLKIIKKKIELPLKQPEISIPSGELAKRGELEKETEESANKITIWLKKLWSDKTFEEQGLVKNGKLISEIQIVSIGNVILVGLPGEIFVEIGLSIKKMAKKNQKIFIIGYANDYTSYHPTASAYSEGGYEINSSFTSPETERILKEVVKEEIESLVGR